jgi:hypothetical protein
MSGPSEMTYSVHHNPNCPKPYLVRLPRGNLDLKYYRDTRDALGFGMTFEEAFANALTHQTAEERDGH